MPHGIDGFGQLGAGPFVDAAGVDPDVLEVVRLGPRLDAGFLDLVVAGESIARYFTRLVLVECHLILLPCV